MTKRFARSGVAVAAVLTLAGAARAGDEADAAKAAYLRYCGACHGPGGKGDGIAGTFMRPKPTDLTQMAEKSGGKFPFEPTMRVIDGRDAVRAHGDPAMPVWGEIFKREAANPTGRDEVQTKLFLIVKHLESIQER
jgi:mono/diheme cytochrome c family protein